MTLPDWNDPRVQVVYEILGDETAPPGNEHQDGFDARRIVAALEPFAAEKVAAEREACEAIARIYAGGFRVARIIRDAIRARAQGE